MEEREGSGHQIGVSNHIVKVIEVLAESPHSWEDAAGVALRQASRSLHDITSIYIKDIQAVVRDGRIAAYRVNAKVSFIVDDHNQRRSVSEAMGGSTMRYRRQEHVREGNYRPTRNEEPAFPDYDEYGLHGSDRRQYRGRESYEQQTRGGEGGRSGMFDQRFVPRDLDEPYRNNADEDRRGYQNIGARQEFESRGPRRPEYSPRGRDDGPRFGFDAQDYQRRDRDRWESQGGGYAGDDDYSRTDYGEPGYGDRGYARAGGRSHAEPPYGERNYGERDYGDRSYERGSGQRDYRDLQESATPSWQRGMYYGESPRYEGRDFGERGRGWGGSSERSYDQGRYASSQYDANTGQRRSGRGPKGYKRSDDRVREDVCDRLSQQYDIDASEVEVTVSNGEVTLAGTVSDRDQKFRIEHLADSVGGVNEVHNQLRVRREAATQAGQTAQSAPNARNATNQSRSS